MEVITEDTPREIIREKRPKLRDAFARYLGMTVFPAFDTPEWDAIVNMAIVYEHDRARAAHTFRPWYESEREFAEYTEKKDPEGIFFSRRVSWKEFRRYMDTCIAGKTFEIEGELYMIGRPTKSTSKQEAASGRKPAEKGREAEVPLPLTMTTGMIVDTIFETLEGCDIDVTKDAIKRELNRKAQKPKYGLINRGNGLWDETSARRYIERIVNERKRKAQDEVDFR